MLRDAAAGAACKHVAALGRAAARLHQPTMIRGWTDFCGDAHRLKTIRISTMKWAIFQKLELNNIGNFRPLDMDRVSVSPDYFCNVIRALSSPLQALTHWMRDPASEKLVANASLPFGCARAARNVAVCSPECALHMFIKHALATKPTALEADV